MNPPLPTIACCFGLLIAFPAPCAMGEALADEELIHILLHQNLDQRAFAFPSVIKASSGKSVIPFDESKASHRRVGGAVRQAVTTAMEKLSREDSPVRVLRRINEASRFFEDEIRLSLDSTTGLRCSVPLNADGRHQRTGYPDLEIIDEASGDVFYLDPKLIEEGTSESTLRTFYFEPKSKSGKIHHDAVHLLVGIEHDGKDGRWHFNAWRLVDLSTVSLRLKAEFQASNTRLYHDSNRSTPPITKPQPAAE